MDISEANSRILFGLKVRQLRNRMGLSFAELSEASGLSVSYLNEIEKGKKHPKPEKMKSLARALKTQVRDLTAIDLDGNLAPVAELLHSNFLQELPLEFFGIDPAKIVEIIAVAPRQVGAFISTLVDLSRNYSLREENFYFGALRAYLEMHHNYFEEIENEAERFRSQYGSIPQEPGKAAGHLRKTLEAHFSYVMEDKGLAAFPDLQDVRAVYLPHKRRLLLNEGLTPVQEAFQFAKELGFQFLDLPNRALTSSLLRVHSFEEVLSHFRASYFAAALLVDQRSFERELLKFLEKDRWDPDMLRNWTARYPVSEETLVQRMSNLLPGRFGLRKLFIWRFVQHSDGTIRVDKELNLMRDRLPSRNSVQEHFCRRWSRFRDAEAQRALHGDTGDAFLSLSIVRTAFADPGRKVSLVLGLLIEEELKKKVRFWGDPAIPEQVVGHTCERCHISGCAERAAPPLIYDAREKYLRMKATLERLADE